jgi:predicted ArsR family transcriptional regulator
MHAASHEGTPGRILEFLKRGPGSSIPDLARAFDLSPETVRAHVRTLVEAGLVEDTGSRGEGRGRPERLYALTRDADRLFPRREAELLRGFVTFLREQGKDTLIADFLDRFAADRRARAERRLGSLNGRARLEEVAKILSEEGYMAEVREGDADAPPTLRLCHCPLRDLVEVSRAPCRAEIALVKGLVGGTLARVEYIPDGDAACAYVLDGAEVS